ncbi:uncharacterized protein C6orf118 homolog isoform X2 [Pyxicephalus adspersus]|uniref:uncharacterized protein C6orf118 homolog isoform X2 n=1 Tax=Pyxicephalus adspersus TaxID=30357 RepID=UPI003B59EF81
MLQTKQQSKMKPLNKLLDKIEGANKKDSWDYTGGHLNHNHVFKPQVLEENTFWRSGQKQQILQHNELRYDIASSKSDKRCKTMKDALTHFTVKTSLVQGLGTKSEGTLTPTIKHFGSSTPINTPFASSLLGTQSYGTCMENLEQVSEEESLQDKELELPDLKVLTFNYELCNIKKGYKDKYKFVPAYYSGLTKSDQFRMFLQIDEEVLQGQDLTKDFCRSSRVEYFEKTLTKKLLNIPHIHPPHFARLQIFSETFGNICNISSVYGAILKQVKNAYELYINYLLDSQSSFQHEILLSEVAGIKKRPVRTEDVNKAEEKVKELEQKSWCPLQSNDQLRNNLKKVNILTPNTNETEGKSYLDFQELKTDNFCFPNDEQTFVLKRSKILKTYYEVKALEDEIRKNMTHMVNTEALEQYLKEVQDLNAEIKRWLIKQKLSLDKQEEIKHVVDSFLKSGEL